MERNIIKRMEDAGVYPSQRLSQHILIDESALTEFANYTTRGGNVLEVGAGPGNITERIARHARSVVAVEIDRKFEPILSELEKEHPNVEVIYGDILRFNLENLVGGRYANWQIMSNLPFSITEPFVKQLAGLPITDAVLILGEQMANRIQTENPHSQDFSRTGLTVQTFFDSAVVMDLPSSYFYPEPGTDSAIVTLEPRESHEFSGNKKLLILRRLFLTEDDHPPIKNVIKEAMGTVDDDVIRSKDERNRYDRRRSKQDLRSMITSGDYENFDQRRGNGGGIFDRLDLPSDILNHPFSRLSNQDLKELVIALDRL